MKTQKPSGSASARPTHCSSDSSPPRYVGIRLLDKVIQATGIFAAWLSLFIVLVTCLVAGLRYGFNVTSTALQESVLYAHAILIMFGVAYALRENAHVRVDIFYRRWSLKQKAILDLLGTLFLLFPTGAFLLISSWDYVSLSWNMHERSTEGDGLPYLYWLKSLLIIGPILILLQGIQLCVGAVRILRNGAKRHD